MELTVKPCIPKTLDKITILPDSAELGLLRLAAIRRNTTVEQFVLRAAMRVAEHDIEDQRTLTVSADEYARLCALLDSPPVELPNLRTALAKPTVWDS
jgi:uncharacterized protein (DUF1778 family)